MRLPSRLQSFRDFDHAVLDAREEYTGIKPGIEREIFLNRMYYLLGWFLGDLGKQFGSRQLMTVGLNLTLTRRHPENQALGDYVFFKCVQNLGIRARRQREREADRSSPYGAYRWDCRRSPLFGWFHLVCFGLGWNQRASCDPVESDWILAAPLKRRLWFVRGLADSDGDVHLDDKSVGITTTPNTRFVYALLRSVGCRPRIDLDGSSSKVVIAVRQAVAIEIFSEEQFSYRHKRLEILANARTFERHWPAWLQEKVTQYLSAGIEPRIIRDRILEEDGVFVRLATLQRKHSAFL